MTREHIHFVTGRLAEHALRKLLDQIAPQMEWDYTVDVLPITVAALMTPPWIARHIHLAAGDGTSPATKIPAAKISAKKISATKIPATKIIVPGYCDGDLSVITAATGLPVERGPRDLRKLPAHFGQHLDRRDYGEYDIEILAEINHAPRLSLDVIVAQAKSLSANGADVIDVGCDPGEPWARVGDCVRALRDAGLRVSIDSFHPEEIARAVQAGAELVLSVNQSNRHAAPDWGCEVVAIPDDIATLGGLQETIEALAVAGVKLRVDPVLEPIGCGFAASLGRYLDVRRQYPDCEMLMGIGNLTELSDADSAPINLLLLGICQELAIHSVLTTQVINWARTSVKECDLARRMVHYASRHGIPPKHIDEKLVLLRDAAVTDRGVEEFDRLAAQVKDHNVRLYAENGQLHLISAGMHLTDRDPYELFDQFLQSTSRQLDASHAFYLGYEFCKAITAITLGKQYEQDEALNWGFLTRPETKHR